MDRKYVLRRLTPIECLRLQGYPDWRCDGANGSDSAIYKAAGNSLAIPCCTDTIGRIVRFVEEEKNESVRELPEERKLSGEVQAESGLGQALAED